MKKLIIVMVVALLALALVACGGDAATTTKGGADTTAAKPADTTAAKPGDDTTAAKPGDDTTAAKPGDTTAAKPGDDSTPTTTPNTTPSEVEGIDIINGADEDRAINATWQGMNAGAFENHHAALDNNWAYVILFAECENAWYTDLVMTFTDEETGEETWMMNEDYKWILTLDGEDIVIERFSVYNVTTYGYVRLDLGSDFVLKEKDDDGFVTYDIKLRIVDATKDDEPTVYYAYMTDPEWNGPHMFEPPAPIEVVVDPNRNPDETEILGATVIEGPAGYDGETFENLFDYNDDGTFKVASKLCFNEVAPIVWTYDAPVVVTSYSIIGANDDKDSPSRVITNFTFWGSADGNTWTKLDEHADEPLTEAVNYAERNFSLSKAAEYQYFKIEFVHEGTFQLSGIQLWTKE